MKREERQTYEKLMDLALAEAEKALKRGDFPVGCILECNGTVIATGSREGTTGESANEVDHAEMVLLRRLAGQHPRPDLNRARIFCTMEPCLMCYAAIILSGINEIIYAFEDVMGGGTGCDMERLTPLYRRKVRILPHVRRRESLALFKTFFSNPANTYWKGSLLARYTLETA
ncbi:Cytidine/deoxycytidylate deaminase, zinc-binding region [Olavius algarvensis associated proteobacterium Delta 3]|nr:Cytidine/deoxycytidylate deaminase, zinc-binding region [Olavius algarvensis associated proteobacterium Delta 3]CAB5170177.1 Cytidine/deoxycytidylate deaminase, zinc-binding region [Olavius algarvensis associated proteobacterium Delta 3]